MDTAVELPDERFSLMKEQESYDLIFAKSTVDKDKSILEKAQWRTLLVNLGYHFITSFFSIVNFYLLNSTFLQ